MPRALRVLLPLAFALAAIVVVASATLRLAANGIGCAPWPACYGQAATAVAANETPLARALRPVHRVAATAFALVALGVVAVGWPHWQRSKRAAGGALLVVTAMLAWVGLYTPSPLPAVTLANVLGGFALISLLAVLWVASVRLRNGGGRSIPTAAGIGIVLLLGLVLQAGGGALISARLAGDACASGCAGAWPAGATALANPFMTGTADELLLRGGQPLQWLHRLGGLLLMLACAITAAALMQRRQPWAGTALFIALATGGLGFAAASSMPALPLVVLHALAAGLLGATLAALLAASHSEERKT